ncbi:MAG: PKD domain-containing protein [Bacteroidota bacterium]
MTIKNICIVSVSDPLINFNPSTIPTVSTDRIDRFEWDFGDGNSRIITDTDELPITHTYTTNGDYTVTLTVFDNVGVAAAPACAMVGAAATKTETVTVSRVGLPVELADFKGEIKEEGIFIEWETATEINNDYFVLEHSTDGKNFLRLATIDGNLNSIVRQNYEYLHRSPKKGWNYYRLQQVDTDGTFTIEAPIISFEWKIDSDIIISPNPAQDRLFLRGVNTGMDYLIFNALGQIKLSGLAQEGQEILIEELPNGVYWLQLFSGNERGEVFQFLKK